MKDNDVNNWDLVLEPQRNFFHIPFKEIIKYKDLIFLFVKRDFIIRYTQTILGPIWFILMPLFSTFAYTFVFGNLAKLSTDGIPHILFYYSGTVLWNLFSECFIDGTEVFKENKNIFGKVYFPRLTVPISNIFSNLIKIAIQFICFILFMIYYLIMDSNINVSIYTIFVPIILVWIAILATGMGLLVSVLTTKYRDLQIVIGFILNLAMFVTPILYPISEIPYQFRWIANINPLCAPIELFRLFTYGKSCLSFTIILSGIVQMLVFTFLGIVMFNKNEQNFIDVI